MAEEHQNTPENSESAAAGEESTTPRRRTRRRAGAPAGAPRTEVAETSAEERSAAPRTTVGSPGSSAPADEQPQEKPAPAARTRRRRAGAPAGPPVSDGATSSESAEAPRDQPSTGATSTAGVSTSQASTAQQATAQASTDQTSAEATSTEEDASGQDAGTTTRSRSRRATSSRKKSESRDGSDGVAGDLQALASRRSSRSQAAPTGEETTTKDGGSDNASRAQAQMDFASLLFQAPEPAAPRTTVGPSDTPVGSSDLAFGVGESSGEDAERGTSRRRRRAESSDADSSDPDSGSEDENGSEQAQDDEESSNGSGRRRRRRGGRGRRGRGRGSEQDSEDENEEQDGGSESEDEGESSSRSSRSRSRKRSGGRKSGGDSGSDSEGGSESSDEDSSSEDSENGSGTDDSRGEDSGSNGSSSRRRRRRRRSGSAGGDDSSSSDDPPNTVVRVREARDEVKAVKGSTRLEAKKQRRRDGRDSGRRRNVITEAEFLARRESVKRSMVVRELPGRTQIAVLEDDVLVEHYVAQKSQTSMVGNVYLGKVQNVLPSMEAAFVDIGKGRNAVLYAGEVNWDAAGLEGQPRRIELALKSGDPVLVQVTKDPIGHKGARLTSQISLPGRYLVYVPGGSMTGISRKLPDSERSRLKKIMRQVIPEDAGVIVRTAAEGASEEELHRDVERLQAQWAKIQKAQKSKGAPAPLSQEPDLAIKVVRDVFNEDFTSLIVEGSNAYQSVHEYLSSVAPDLLERLTQHVGEKDVFAKHRIDEQLLKAMDRKVYLPSGGSLVIDRTEAMTVIDVNTGKFTGAGGSLEETVTKNNIEAAEEIVRQLRLRDIGGIIVVDFIDMVLEANRDLVLRRLVECLGRDRTKHQVAEVTSLGLVQMTRKRVGQGLVETFSSPCEACNGRGLIVDVDGHTHATDQADEESSRSSRRGGRGKGKGGSDGGKGSGRSEGGKRRGGGDDGSGRSGGSAAEAVSDLLEGSNAQDVHRVAEDEKSREIARATIASIARASTASATPEVTVDGEVVTPQSTTESPAGEASSADADRDPSPTDANATSAAPDDDPTPAPTAADENRDSAPSTDAEPAPTGGSTDAPAGDEEPAPTGGSTDAPAGDEEPAPTGGSTDVPAGDEEPVSDPATDPSPEA